MQISLEALKNGRPPPTFRRAKTGLKPEKFEHFTEKEGDFEGRISIRDRAQITQVQNRCPGSAFFELPLPDQPSRGDDLRHIIAVMLAWRAENADPMAERAERVEHLMKTDPERRRHFRKPRLRRNRNPNFI